VEKEKDTGSKIVTGVAATLFTLAYTFSAMPLTVNFFRTVIPLKPEIQNTDLAKGAEKVIGLSPVLAVPGLLLFLEIMSIQIATSIWMMWLGKSDRKALRKLIILFAACQAYPFIGTVYKVSEINKAFYETKVSTVENRNDKKDTDTEKKRKDRRIQIKESVASIDSDIKGWKQDIKSYDDSCKDYFSQKNPTKAKSDYCQDAGVQIKALRAKIAASELMRDLKRKDIEDTFVTITKDNINDNEIYGSVVEFYVRRFWTPENLFGLFLAFLFPSIILAVGFYWANSKEIEEIVKPAGDLLSPNLVFNIGNTSTSQTPSATNPPSTSGGV
jgi:hypothetical protein